MILAFLWVLVMLLIVSFVTLSYLKFQIKWMIVASALAAVIAGIVYVTAAVKKYRKYYGK